MPGFIQKLRLIAWKNCIIRKRHWLLTIFEIFMPILLFILMAYVRAKIPDIKKEYQNHTSYYEASIVPDHENVDAYLNIFYAPNHDFENNLMEKARMKLKIPKTKIRGFKTMDVLMSVYGEESMGNNTENIMVIEFDNVMDKGDHPRHLNYKIGSTIFTWETEINFMPALVVGPINNGRRSNIYFRENFLDVQSALDLSYMEIAAGNKPVPIQVLSFLMQHGGPKQDGGLGFLDHPFSIRVSNERVRALEDDKLYHVVINQFSLQQFPYPPYMEDSAFRIVYEVILPLITLFSFLLLCPSLIKRIVEEKVAGVKELMKLMGLESWMLWTGWMLHVLVVNIPSITVIVILLKVSMSEAGPVIPECSGVLLWIFLFLYCIAGISQCFFISTWFNKPTIAMCAGEVFWMLTYFVPNSLMGNSKLNLASKLLLSLFPNTALNFGYQTIATFESREVGLQWSNLFSNPSENSNDMSMAVIFLMLIVNVIMYSTLTWYVDNVRPGPYGLARSWYFPFTSELNLLFKRSYWMSSKVEDSGTNTTLLSEEQNYEEPSAQMVPGVVIKNLRKNFGKKTAVDGLTLDIYKGIITVLLGHNGAGKTTTMSILTGMFSPTSGDVYINGLDIRTDLNKVRNSLGLCPQHNMFFPDLNVLEHLIFFAKLKGSSHKKAHQEAQNLLNLLKISSKSTNMPKTLSGGMRRKLALGIALVGQAEVLMLDEPTSGMDPEARREIWDLLLKMRGQRTIIITTHFMEEADVLGDRIVIMDHGKLQCYGSSLFLKRKYGAGYQLSLMKGGKADDKKILDVIQKNVPNVVPQRKFGALLTYTLPTEDRPKFPKLFEQLETNKANLSIEGIGLSITTLDEVFLRVGQIADEMNSKEKKKFVDNTSDQSITGSKEKLNASKLRGVALELSRFKALFIKKCLYTYRKWFVFGLHAIAPILITILAIILGQPKVGSGLTGPPLLINLDAYGKTEVLYSSDADMAHDISTFYSRLDTKSSFESVDDLNDEIIRIGTENIVHYLDMLIVGAQFNKSGSNTILVNGMFASRAVHSAPISLNMISNAVLRYLVKDSKYSITVTNQPLERKTKDSVRQQNLMTTVQIAILWLILVPLGLLFLIGIFIHFPLTERVSKIKQLQFMAGVNGALYWLSCYVFDFLLYIVVGSVILVAIVLVDTEGVFANSEAIGVLAIILLMYGLSGILYSYFISYCGKTVSGAFTVLLISNMLFGVIATTAVTLMQKSNDIDLERWGDVLNAILLFIPHYALSYGLLIYSIEAGSRHQCENMEPSLLEIMCKIPEMERSKCCELDDSFNAYFDWKTGIGKPIMMLGLDVIVYAILLTLLEYNVVMWTKDKILKMIYKPHCSPNRTDEDVIMEHKRVSACANQFQRGMHSPNDILLVNNLEKVYNGKFQAVRGVSFGVATGECFGLLGVNGAGKTTTFQMLTGDEIQTSGDAIISSFKLSEDKKQYLSNIGYCPQYDALNDALTGEEMLTLFGHLRGVPTKELTAGVNYWLTELGLTEFRDRLCGTYSGGNKRKLNTAVALIGNPPLVLLDEPTSGVDPISRRNLWNVLTKIQREGQSIVLTSHSMEECEALCGRLAIMVSGQLVCLGTIQYIKHRFGQGFTLMLKVKPNTLSISVVQLKDTICKEFTSAVLKDEHEGLLHYHITDPSTKWSNLFQGMENIQNRDTLGIIEDYTISETTLEQVFLHFAQNQNQNHVTVVEINNDWLVACLPLHSQRSVIAIFLISPKFDNCRINTSIFHNNIGWVGYHHKPWLANIQGLTLLDNRRHTRTLLLGILTVVDLVHQTGDGITKYQTLTKKS